jgi:putative transposase
VTRGLLRVSALVTEASISDKQGAMQLLTSLNGKLPRMQRVWADGGYGGTLTPWMKDELGWELEVVKHPSRRQRGWVSEDYEIDWAKVLTPKGFHVLPKRWVVERTFAWLNPKLRLSKDYEYLLQAKRELDLLDLLDALCGGDWPAAICCIYQTVS